MFRTNLSAKLQLLHATVDKCIDKREPLGLSIQDLIRNWTDEEFQESVD
jgi:hypothetical protein